MATNEFYDRVRRWLRWGGFSSEELAVINQALIDSESRHSEFSWYQRCADLQRDIALYKASAESF